MWKLKGCGKHSDFSFQGQKKIAIRETTLNHAVYPTKLRSLAQFGTKYKSHGVTVVPASSRGTREREDASPGETAENTTTLKPRPDSLVKTAVPLKVGSGGISEMSTRAATTVLPF